MSDKIGGHRRKMEKQAAEIEAKTIICAHGQLARVCQLCEYEARIEELDAEVASLTKSAGGFADLYYTAEAKLAAIEQAPKHTHIAEDAAGDFEYVKWADIQDILRGESEGRE